MCQENPVLQNQWTVVDEYLENLLVPADKPLSTALQAMAEAGMPTISVTPTQGKLLYQLAKISGVRSILEIGTLGGYSTIWLARALPDDGRLITLEIDPAHAAVARANVARANLKAQVEVRVGKAVELLSDLEQTRTSPFDLVFIDADSVSAPDYVAWARRLTKPSSLIIIDNVIRNGAVIDTATTDRGVQAVRKALDMLAQDKGLITTVMQTVGKKGYDGMAIAWVTSH
jgi:predicted O-methyltransferase YrrM